MKATRETAVIVRIEPDEVHLLRNALHCILSLSTSNIEADAVDQFHKVRDLIALLDGKP